MIPRSFIHDLLARADIVELIDAVVPLKKSGSEYAACCPFHNEKTPSFTVSPTKQFYHCFGCGAHGTAIDFLMEYQGMGFVEAVRDLAARLGMPVPEDNPATLHAARDSASHYRQLADVMARASAWFREQLKHAPKAIAYLKERGLSGEVAARFGLGYAPVSGLAAALADVPAEILKTAGLVKENERGLYDYFRDRVMFPILNAKGEVIAFGGRVMGAGEPKYLNSPETPLFEKGREVFGLPQARKALRAENCAIVVEGYMDVVALSQHGISHAVATLGTSTTPTHVQKLLRQVDRLVFCFDGDAAGRKAAWRALENALESLADNKILAFAFLPEAEDPDSFVRAQGNAAFRNLIAQATPLSDFLLRELGRRSDLATAEGRAKLVAEAKPLIVRVPTPLLRLQLVKRLAEASGFSQQEVEKLTGLRGSTRPAPAKSPRHKPSLSRKLLRFVLRRPALAARLPRALLPVEGDEAAALLCAITEALTELPPEASYAQLREQLRGHPLEERLDALAGEWLGMGAFSAEEEDAKEAEEAEFSAALELLRQGAEQAGFADLQVKARQFGVAGLSAEEKETYLHLLMQKNNRKI